MFRLPLQLGALLAIVVASTPAWSQPACPQRPAEVSHARTLAGKYWRYAERFYKDQLYREAIKAWQCSYSLMPHPLALFNIARSADLAQQPDVALENYEAYLRANPSAADRATIEERIRALRKAGVVPPRREEPPAEVPRDERPADGVQADPRHPGSGTEPPPPPARSQGPVRPSRSASGLSRAGWAFIGLGLAVGVAGAGLGGAAVQAKGSVEGAPDGSIWTGSYRSAYDRYPGLKAGAWASAGVSGAMVLLGAILVAVDRKRRRNERVTVMPVLLPGGAALTIGGAL